MAREESNLWGNPCNILWHDCALQEPTKETDDRSAAAFTQKLERGDRARPHWPEMRLASVNLRAD